MTEPRLLKVFLCHASADKPAVRKLYRYLRTKGMDPWLDAEKLLPGQKWQIEIPKALYDSDAIIVFLSTNSTTQEGFVQKEIKFALDKALEMPEDRIFLIPARLEDCEVPESLKSYHWVDLFEKNWNRRLMQSLNQRAVQLGLMATHPSVEETQPPVVVPKFEEPPASKPSPEPEKPARTATPRLKSIPQENGSVDIGGDAKGTTIITGDHNVIVQSPIGDYDVPPKKDEPVQTPVGQIANLSPVLAWQKEQEKKPARKFNFRKIGIIGILLIVLMFGIFGINYAINNWPDAVVLTPTSQPPTKVVTFTPKPPTATITSIPSTSTITPAPPTSIPTPGIGSAIISEKDNMTLVFVPAGEFTMGDGSESHKVTLASFWIDQTEVTNKMYALCVQDGTCQPPSSMSSYTRKDYYGNSEFDDYPVIYVDWNKAKTYCKWAGRRLPTEAEWEKAARGTDARTYPWGNDAPNSNLLNYNQNVGDTTEVGKYPAGASIYGALDMAGNVWEWVSSLYQSYPYSATDGREDLNASGSRVLRGGSWIIFDSNVRSASRLRYDPTVTIIIVGFRCSRSP